MARILHILNGDSTRHEFEKSGIPGDVMVWHEMLVEGPAIYPILSEAWVAKRKQYINEVYECPPHLYDQRTQSQFAQLQNVPDYQEVVLWFEFDLFCQINLIGAISALKHLDAKKVSLVCPGEHSEIEDFCGLGQLSSQHFEPLFEERTELVASDLDFGDRLYQAYANEDPRFLQAFLAAGFPPAFPFLQAAITRHFQRFPTLENGLSQEEKEMLAILQNDVLPDRRHWVGKMLRANAWWGYGDLQYFHRIKRLETLFDQSEELIELNELGKAVLDGFKDFLSINEQEVWLGGARNIEWRWDGKTEQLVPARKK